MFKIKKNNIEFIFLETEETVSIYKNKENKINKIEDIKLSEIAIFLEKFKKQDKDIFNSKNIWLLSSRSENIEKIPLNKEEMIGYAKWKIQEIIDVSMHDVYYDILTNNNIENNFYKKYTTAIIVKKYHVDNIIKCFASNKIKLDRIDSKNTALLDFFAKNKSLVEKKALTYLKIEESKVIMYVYYESGFVFDRVIDIPKLKQYENDYENISKEDYVLILNKICLEIQRNIDFLERQYGVQHFENIIYSFPNISLFNNLSKEISTYFNIDYVNINEYLTLETNEFIPFDVWGVFVGGNIREEHISLIPKEEKNTRFIEDLKTIIMLSLLFGLLVAIGGATYEWKTKDLKYQLGILETNNKKITKELEELKKKTINKNDNLEKEITNLNKNKNELIRFQSEVQVSKKDIYIKMLEDIAIKASKSGVILSKIKINDNSLALTGIVKNKELFTVFLKNLQESNNLKGVSLGGLSIKQKDQGFEFNISSENMGDK